MTKGLDVATQSVVEDRLGAAPPTTRGGYTMTTLTVREIPVADIVVPEGRRELREENVLELMESIQMLGLQQPITVREVDDQHVLVAGAHRHEACKRLEWTTIPSGVFTGTELDARIYEIDENLRRAELTAPERVRQIAERVRLTEQRVAKRVKEEQEAAAKATQERERERKAEYKAREKERRNGGGDNSEESTQSSRPEPEADPKPKAKPGPKEKGEAAAAREMGMDRAKLRKIKKADTVSDENMELAKELGVATESALLKAAEAGWEAALAAGGTDEALWDAVEAYRDTGVDTAQEKLLRTMWAAQEASLRQQAEAKKERKEKPRTKRQDREEQGQVEYCMQQWLDLRMEIERLPEDIVRRALAQIQEDIDEVLAAYDELKEETT